MASARHSHVKLTIFLGLNGDKPGRMGFRLGLTTDGFLLVFGSVTGLVFGVVVTLFFFSLDLVFGGTRLLLMPSRPRFMMLAGVTGAIVSSVSVGSGFLGSALEASLGEGDGLAGGGMEKSCPDELVPAKFEVIVIGVEVADLTARFRTTTEAIDDLRLGMGFSEESSSLGDALLLLETTGAGACWV